METPKEVAAALDKLDSVDKDVVEKYISSLQDSVTSKDAEIMKLKGEQDDEKDEVPKKEDDEDMKAEEEEEENVNDDEPEFPPLYTGTAEDFEKASDAKQDAADLQSNGDWEGALSKYNEAVLAAPPSALLYANRAKALLKLGRPRAAERDCDLALQENPDSAKALRMRGKARKDLGKYELALKDLSASQTIDFDEDTVQDLKFLAEKHVEMEKAQAEARVKEEEKLRKRAEEIKKAQAEAKHEASSAKASSSARGSTGGMGGGMGGGMPGMPGGMPAGAADMMNDPELIAAMQNPKVSAALQELMSGPGGPMGLMSNPAKLQELMSDPDVGPVLSKLMGKFMGGGGMGGMGGGMPGGMGGSARGGGASAAGNDDEDEDMDMPDLEEMD